jgi:hypothetical protein
LTKSFETRRRNFSGCCVVRHAECTAISKELHKKIKKAGKLLAEEISELKKAAGKATKPAKNQYPKRRLLKRP